MQPLSATSRVGIAAIVFAIWSDGATAQRPIDQVGTVPQSSAPGTTDKIVGGTPAPAGKFPFQVALIKSDSPVGAEHFGQFCGGALIDKRWVVTAAHCVPRTRPEEVDVYVGATVLPSGGGTGGGVVGHRRHVTQIVSHQKYDPDTNDNDIALLKLSDDAPAELTPSVPANADADAKHVKSGNAVTVIGWGLTSEGAATTSPILNEVEVRVQSSQVCQTNYRQVIPGTKITPNMFCAGEPAGGKDSCQGDSGGFIGAPLEGGRWAQLGIVSWGVGCARPRLFGVYTRVGEYDAWIKQMMSQF